MPDLQPYTASGNKSSKKENLVGQRFGKLTVIEKTETTRSYTKYRCLCECGKEKIVIAANLKRGMTKTCGCGEKANRESNWKKFTTHGLSKKHPIHATWNHMKGRCYNKNNEKYKDYGGRGITVCEEWLSDFMNFYNWAISNGWEVGLTIDRIRVNGNYEPSNCRWADSDIQANNKRNSVFITYNDEVKTISQWAKVFNIPAYLIGQRLKRNWPVNMLFTTEKYKRVG